MPVQRTDPLASYNLSYRNVTAVPFNGEKTPGMAGPMLEYKFEYQEARIRSWQAYIESDLAQIAIRRKVTWVISKGLKKQAEPIMDILNDEGIQFDKKKFTKSVESRFNLFRKDKKVDYAGQKNLNQLSKVAVKNALIGGDVLVVLRVVKGKIKIQLIDGAHVQSPYYGTEDWPQNLADGNMIVNGVEINSKREHVAYYVKTYAVDAKFENLHQYKFDRIEAKGKKTGRTMAYLYYGTEFRIDNVRGMPLLSVCIEKLANLDLYSTATLKQAQEASKVDYQVVHDKEAKPIAPWAKSTVSGFNGRGGGDNSNLPVTDDGEQLFTQTHITGIGTAYNNSPGSKLEMLTNENPLYFKDFYETHSDIFFAIVQIPPNVAMGKYNDSFSASRAAGKDWEHTFLVDRDDVHMNFLDNIDSLWFDLEILNNRIQAPGYILARVEENDLVMDAYRNCRFVGPGFPHIDPLKEANAARVILGKAAECIPLNDVEGETENLGRGDASENMEQFAQELKESKQLGIKLEPILQQAQKGKGKKGEKEDDPEEEDD